MRWIRQSLVLQFLIFSLVLTIATGVSVGTILSPRIEHTTELLIEHGKAMHSGIEIDPTAEISTPRLISEVRHLGTSTYSLLASSFAALFIGVVVFFWLGSGRIRKQRDEQSRLAEENALIAEVGRIISSSLDITEVYEGFAREMRKLIPFDRIVVGLVDLEKDTFTPAHIIGTNVEGRGVGDTLPLSGSSTEQVVRKKAPLLISTGSVESFLDRFPAGEPGYRAGLRSIIAIPLISQDQVLGILRLQSAGDSDYTGRDLALLERVGSQIAGAVANAQLYEALKQAEEEERRVAVENRALAEIGRIISSSSDINDVYARVTEEARNIISFDRMSVSFVDFDDNVTIQTYTSGVDIPGRQQGDHTPLVGALAGEVALTRLSMMFEAESEEDVLNRFPLLIPAFRSGLRSFISVPLVDRDNVTGVFQIRSTELGVYSQRDLDITERIAGQIAGALANARLYEEQRRLAQETSVIAEIGRIVSSSFDINGIYGRLGEEVCKLIPFDRFTISLVNHEKGTSSQDWALGTEVPTWLRGKDVPLSGHFAGEVVRRRLSILLEADNEPELGNRFPGLLLNFRAGMRSFLAAPLIHHDNVIGVFQLRSKELGVYCQTDLDLVGRIASQIAGAITNSHLYESLQKSIEEMAVVDEVAQIVTSTLVIDDVYDVFASEVKRLVAFDRMTINIIDSGGQTFTTKHTFGELLPGRVKGSVSPVKGSREEIVVSEGKTLIQGDIASGSSWPMDQSSLEIGLRSVILVPLTSNARVIGTFGLRGRERSLYGIREKIILERLANQIAPAIENAKLYEDARLAQAEQRRLADENLTLAEIGRIVSSSLRIDEVYAQFSQEVSKLIAFDNINIVSVNHEQSSFTIRYHDGIVVPGRALGQTIPLAGSATERAVLPQKGELRLIEAREDIERCDWMRLPNFDAGLRSFLSVPLIFRDSVNGVLHFRSTKPLAYTHRDLDLAERIGLQIAPALENAGLHQETLDAEEAERQRSAELGILLEAASILAQPGSFDEKVSTVMEKLTAISGADLAVFRVPDNGSLRRIGTVEELPYSPEVLPLNGTIAAKVFEDKQTFITDDYTNHPLATKNGIERGVKSVLSTPIMSGDSVLGVMSLTSPKPGLFTPVRLKLLMGIINGLGTLLENANLGQERRLAEKRVQETAHLVSIGELAAGVAHEINNPLTSVQGYSEMVLTKNLPEEVSADIQTIYDEAQRAAKIVQNLLFFARKRNTEKQYLDLNSVLIRSLEMKSYDFRVNNIRVVTDLAPEIHKTMVDEHQLVQVFLNILTNAEQAIHQGGAQGQIWVSTTGSDDRIKITIKDDGPGIVPEDLGKIFEPFFTTKEVGQGTGLGLSISYGIIKQHDGDLWAESVEGDGTAFHITLPVVASDELNISDASSLSSAERTTKHILVVDDEPQIRNLLGKYLESERYTVDLAEDGHEAWRKAANMDYDCIILDLKMPGMSGPELYNLIQEISEHLASKVVFVTGDMVSPGTQDFVSGTGNPVVVKPFRMAELLRTIHELWDQMAAVAE